MVSGSWQRRLWPPGDAALASELCDWLEVGAVRDGRRIRDRDVWLLPERRLAIKFARGPRAATRLRRLHRAAAGAARVAPLPAPAPHALVTGRTADGQRCGALAMDLMPGVPLDEAWDLSGARAALGEVLVELHRRRIAHGDLHPANLLWDGERLALIDLDGLRPPLHALFFERFQRRLWAGLRFRLPEDERLRAIHAAWCAACGLGDPDRHWRRCDRMVRRIRQRVALKRERRLA